MEVLEARLQDSPDQELGIVSFGSHLTCFSKFEFKWRNANGF